MDPLEQAYNEWMAQHSGQAANGYPDASLGLPALPEYPAIVPQAPAPLTAMDRLALALSTLPAPGPRPYESAGAAAVRGGISGFARGFSGARGADMKQRETARTEENAAAKAAADKEWQLAVESHRKRVGARVDRYGKPIETQAEKEARIRSEAKARAEGAAAGRPPAAAKPAAVREPKRDELRWTPVGAGRIRAADAAIERAIADGRDGLAEKQHADELKKADFVAQIRDAKSLRVAEVIAGKARAQYPHWRGSPMIRTVIQDKMNEFRPRLARGR